MAILMLGLAFSLGGLMFLAAVRARRARPQDRGGRLRRDGGCGAGRPHRLGRVRGPCAIGDHVGIERDALGKR